MKKSISVVSLVQEIKEKLYPAYDDLILCEQYAWWTIEAIVHKKKAALLIEQQCSLTDEQHQAVVDWTNKMVHEHMPIQYLLGSVPFNGVDILVKPPVLIPRPETEEWILNLAEQLKKLPKKTLRILDLCTGSGCIAITLAKYLPHAHIVATDVADAALELAKCNAQRNGVTTITFIASDVYDALAQEAHFDLIVANPPYISTTEWKDLDRSVVAWEDPGALVANDEGLEIIKKIINGAQRFLRQHKQMEVAHIHQIVIEIGYAQGKVVKELLYAAGFTTVEIKKDLEGKDRIAQARV